MDDSVMAGQYCLRFQEMTQLESVRCVGPSPRIVVTESTALADPGFLLKAEIQLLEAEIAQLELEFGSTAIGKSSSFPRVPV